MLRRIEVANFRSLKSVAVDLGPLTVLVGPNGAGKTNFLDVIQFLGDSARLDLAPAIEMRDGWERLRFRGKRDTNRIRIRVVANVTRHSSPTAPDDYSLEFHVGQARRRSGAAGSRYIVREETFTFKRTRGQGRRLTVSGDELRVLDETATGEESSSETSLQSSSLALSTLPRLTSEKGGEQIGQLANLFLRFRIFDVDVEQARQASSESQTDDLAPDARNLAPFMHFLSNEHPDRFASLLSDARSILPGLEGLEFKPIGGSRQAVELRIRERGLAGTTVLAEASYGTIRSLALLALLYNPSPPELTCVEEFDRGLHPHALDILVERARQAAHAGQLILSSHAPALVNRLEPAELVVCERAADGSSLIPAIDSETVREMEEAAGGLRLGELWFTGVLGGGLD